jgi:hypothetical protein
MYNTYPNPKMSVDNLNVENRTMNNLVLLPGNIRRALPRTPRRCSFCFGQGHNINTCNDTRLIDIENECIQQKQLYALSDNYIIMFRHWLCLKIIDNAILVKAFAVRKCGARIRSNIDECIAKIVNYVYQDTHNGNNLEPLMLSLYHRMLIFMNFEEAEREINLDRKFSFESKVENFDIDDNCNCAICYDDNIRDTNFVKLNCSHTFCDSCVKKTFQHINEQIVPRCALCRTEISSVTFKDENIKTDFCNIISI